jgi:hypothetical protein
MSPMKDRIAKVAAPEGHASSVPFRRPTGRASYPRRMTLDLDTQRYEVLRKTAYDSRLPAAAILRAALDLIYEDSELAGRVLALAHRDNPPA